MSFTLFYTCMTVFVWVIRFIGQYPVDSDLDVVFEDGDHVEVAVVVAETVVGLQSKPEPGQENQILQLQLMRSLHRTVIKIFHFF